jgi:hypothetical protein
MPEEEQPKSRAGSGDGVVTGDKKQSDDAVSAQDDAVVGEKAGKKSHAAAAKKPDAEPPSRRLFSSYGLASAVLGVVAVAAVVVGLIAWSMHRSDVADRTHRSQVMQRAAGWTSVLINLNAGNVEDGMAQLRDKTVGQLHEEFDAALRPYREVVQRIQSRSKGQIESVAIEKVHYEPGGEGGGHAEQPPPGRTDPVIVIATSLVQNLEGKPQTVHWALQLNVTDVDGQLLISRMSSIR